MPGKQVTTRERDDECKHNERGEAHM